MERISMSLSEKIEKELNKELEKSLQDPDFCALVKRCKLPKDVTLKNNTKLMDTVDELKNCKTCKGITMCKNKLEGHVLYPEYDETLKFIYMPCKFQKMLEKRKIEKEKSINELASARMKDIDINDKNRVGVIKWLKNFYDNFEKVNTLKGLYLHGSFGSGKTYLIAALLNELEKSKNASIEIVYFPELLRNMKEDFNLAQDKINYLENIDILLIDDIGAEKVTEWGRDEVLGTILQHRMNNKLTTFFTSSVSTAKETKV